MSIADFVRAYGNATRTFEGLHSRLQGTMKNVGAVGNLSLLFVDPSKLSSRDFQAGIAQLRLAGEDRLADLFEKIRRGQATEADHASARYIYDGVMRNWMSSGKQALGEISNLESTPSMLAGRARKISETQQNAFMAAIGNMKA